MDKTFTIAGVSVIDGRKTYRFANGNLKQRESTLKHFGHTGIELMALAKPMTKEQAVVFLQKKGIHAEIPVRGLGKSNVTDIRTPVVQTDAAVNDGPAAQLMAAVDAAGKRLVASASRTADRLRAEAKLVADQMGAGAAA